MYKVEYLPAADADIEEAEAYLGGFSTAAADKLSSAIEKQTAILINNPALYPVSRYNDCLRCMPLPYKYLCFYHVDEAAKTVRVYRILRGMRDVSTLL